MIVRPLAVNTGQLRTPFRHQSPSITVAAHGAPQTEWIDRGIVWGTFESATGKTVDRAQSDEGEGSAKILLRHRPANPAKPGDRLVTETVWRINATVDPDGTQRFTRAYCTSARSDSEEEVEQ